jgi:predicted nucleotidyltransferase
MLSVPQALQQYLSSLEIDGCDGEQCGRCTACDARRQRDNLRAHLERSLAVSEFLISGSFARRTAIAPLNDIDLFVVLDPNSERALFQAAPRETLRRVASILDRAYPTKERPKEQSRSVNVDFRGTGLAFDVVPAFPYGDGYAIPDRDAGRWIRTNPRVHKDMATRANEVAGKKAKPIVKALKSWQGRQAAKPVRSFHLELMVYDALQRDPGSYSAGIAAALRHMTGRVLSAMAEPAQVGPYVDDGMTLAQRQQASAAFAAAADIANQAIGAADRGNTAEAHHYWRALLGPAYPERGTPPSTTRGY